MQAPPHLSYPEVHQVQRIRSMMPKTVEDFFRDHEIGHPGGGLLDNYDALLLVLRRQDELFKGEMAGKQQHPLPKGSLLMPTHLNAMMVMLAFNPLMLKAM